MSKAKTGSRLWGALGAIFVALGTIAAGAGAGAAEPDPPVITPFGLVLPTPVNMSDPANAGLADGVRTGWGYHWDEAIGGTTGHWLGAFAGAGTGKLEWCINLEEFVPLGQGEVVVGFAPNPPSAVPANLRVTNAEMGWILAHKEGVDEPLARSALAVLAHANYENGGARDSIAQLLVDSDRDVPGILATARAFVQEARAAQPGNLNTGTVHTENKMDWVISGISVQDNSGRYVPGRKFEVTISGPAVFHPQDGIVLSADGKTATGTTNAGPLSLAGVSTGNGTVTSSTRFWLAPEHEVIQHVRPAGAQTTLSYRENPTEGAPTPKDGPTFEVVYDFQPLLASDVAKADSQVVGPETTVLRDHLTVEADPAYPNPIWLGVGRTIPSQDSYVPLPVKFSGTAYYVGEEPFPGDGTPQVPAGAIKVAEASFVADTGPGEYLVEARFDPVEQLNDEDAGFITWLWEMKKSDQPEIRSEELYMLKGDWADSFGLHVETTSKQWPGEVESELSMRTTKNSFYLTDEVWVSRFPESHPHFRGSPAAPRNADFRPFAPDRQTIEQRLYFWPEGIPVTPDLEAAIQVGKTTTIPAANGYYPNQGDLTWKLQLGEDGRAIPGTYQMVHSFEGDDRVQPFTGLIPDPTEQFVVLKEGIGTTASNAGLSLEGETWVQTITDEVCYFGLDPDKEYELRGTLMDKETGAELVDPSGDPVTSQATFTPDAPQGCTEVTFKVPEISIKGKTTVVFEELFLEGVSIAHHADLEDEKQTVIIPTVKTSASNAQTGDNLVEPSAEVRIKDEVCYTNLRPGDLYVLRGTLMEKATKKPLVVEGGEVTAEVSFQPGQAAGCTSLEFSFPGEGLKAGADLVVFENLFRDDLLIAVHADLADEGQTVTVKGVPLARTGLSGAALAGAGFALLLGGTAMLFVHRYRR